MDSSRSLSIVIPVYNEEANLRVLYERVKNSIKQLSLEHEIIFVNDGSADNSLNIIKDISQADLSVKYISFSRNFGHQIAVSAGLDKCCGGSVVIIDADLQDPPELIPELYKKLNGGYEVVYAKRRNRQGERFLKKFTGKLFYRLLARITSIDIPLDTGDFRIMDKKVVEILRQMPEREKFIRGQIAWIGFHQTFIEYDRDPRYAGKTGYSYGKMFRLALDGITSFSNFPLKFATIAGFVVSGISFLLMLYALYSRYILERYQPGWTSLMLSVLFIGGIQLVGIGIIGEYIGRMSANIRNRPLYVVRETNIEK